ncbi:MULTISPECIES: hypothetical protein [unclassified Paenibacillus]|uniref:hypothetical protein n=1 Tax=unclassified Paenibacillus TaxID=185978 RepID=UPI001AEA1163|nr:MULTISPECIES: hypothetical protein [unclassified Paenibacillus]MBP1153699.1 hypothetical protein [Paenibacillus sp. PvP091]MBP1170916.1 hypothetical protein [Paenibacillus sp. PvR098]MBP2441944.1 hypothetical protein [Paenibacillus sp. PvP052]
MIKLGLDPSELESILIQGIEDEKARVAIANAISANNEAVAKQVLALVSNDLMNLFKQMGMK